MLILFLVLIIIKKKNIINLFTFDIYDKVGNTLIIIYSFNKRINLNSKMFKIY